MTNPAESAGHIAHAAENIDSAKSLNTSLESDLSSYLDVLDKLDERIASVGVGLEATNLARLLGIGVEAVGAADHVEAADETHHFEETTNALTALKMVEDSADGGHVVLTEAVEKAGVAVAALKELVGAIKAVHDQCSEVTVSLLSAAANVEQLGQRFNVG